MLGLALGLAAVWRGRGWGGGVPGDGKRTPSLPPPQLQAARPALRVPTATHSLSPQPRHPHLCQGLTLSNEPPQRERNAQEGGLSQRKPSHGATRPSHLAEVCQPGLPQQQ